MVFVGVDGMDVEGGVRRDNEDEGGLKGGMWEVGEGMMVVRDWSKLNGWSLDKMIDSEGMEMMIVDEGIGGDSVEGVGKGGVEVIVVGE